MSVIFGVRKLPGETATEQELRCLAASSERYAPDGTFVHRRQDRYGLSTISYNEAVSSGGSTRN